MKKWAFVFLILLVIVTALTYVLIPDQLKASAVSNVQANPRAVSLLVSERSGWQQWWPDENKFTYHGREYNITKPIYNGVEITITDGSESVSTYLTVIFNGAKNSAFEWRFDLEAGRSPIRRVIQYRKAAALKNDLRELLEEMKPYYEEEKNLYGFTVKETFVTDSVLIFTSGLFDHYPDAVEVNTLVEKLRIYISKQNAHEQNYPMLNVADLGNGYEARVAIAVDRMLPETKEFAPKQVLKGGNILEAEIPGGPHTIRKAFENFERYKADHQRISPAMPYQLMVTDRVNEPDTAKWVTRLYYPVF